MPRKSSLSFPVLWRLLGGPELTPEVYFHPTRKWRFDWLWTPPGHGVWSVGKYHRTESPIHPCYCVAIEIEGGTWKGGRHTSGKGFLEDCAKYNAAHRLGFLVYRLGTGMVTPEHVQPIIDSLKK